MTVKKVSVGSGLTQVDAFRFEEPLRPDEQALLDSLSAEHKPLGKLAAIERHCIEVLEASKLPTDWTQTGRTSSAPWPVVRKAGYSPDSSEGFAARMLGDIAAARRALRENDMEEVAMSMFYLGHKWASTSIKRGHGAKSKPERTPRKLTRDVALAREFLRRRDTKLGQISDTELKATIGLEQVPVLRRNTAIEAINRGLMFLSG
jgi:hypothetical protein